MCITYYHDHKSLTLVGICPALDSGFDAAFLVLLCNELVNLYLNAANLQLSSYF